MTHEVDCLSYSARGVTFSGCSELCMLFVALEMLTTESLEAVAEVCAISQALLVLRAEAVLHYRVPRNCQLLLTYKMGIQ